MSEETKVARGTGADMGRSKKKGTEFVRVNFAYLNEKGEKTGGGISWDGYLTEKTAERTIESLLACGWDGKDWVGFNGIDQNAVQLVLSDESYEGKTYKRVQWVNKLSAGREIPEELRIVGKGREQVAQKYHSLVSSIKGERIERPKPSFDDDGGDEFEDDDFPY